MADIWSPNNPGISGLRELTSDELSFVQSLAALGDPDADRILFWDDSAGAYAYLTPGTGITITGTTITASASAPSLDGISDVVITTPADNELLAYDSTSSDWINQTPSEAGFATVATSGSYDDLSNTPTIPSSIDDLSDVDTSTTAPTDGQVLAWNDADSLWEPADAATGSGTPAGSDGEIQFNNSGSFGADSEFTFTGGSPSPTLTIGGSSADNAIIKMHHTAPTLPGYVLLTTQSFNGSSITVKLPTASTNLIGEDTSDTLTNKDLSDASNTFPTFNQDTTGSAASFTGSLSGDVTGTQSATVVEKINGVSLAGLSTGILKNTTTTGVPSIAVAADFPTLNQDTTGNAATATALETARTIAGVSFDGTANISITAADVSAVPTTRTVAGHALSADVTITASDVSAIPSSDAPTGDIVGTTDSQTVTNKRNEPRTSSSTSTATLTPSLSTANVFYLTAQAADLTIANPTGTPVTGEVLAIYVTDNATSQTLSFGTEYKAFGAALPTATTAGKTLMIVCQFDGTNWSTVTSTQQ